MTNKYKDLNAYEGMRPYAFISYAHKDTDIVLPILRAMQNEGIRLWFDKGIEAGTEWAAYIEDHLEACTTFIMFLSKNSIESPNCRDEFNMARDTGKEVLVVYIEKLENSDLKHGLRLRILSHQALFKHRHDTDESFYSELFKTKLLDPCRREEGEVDEQPKRKSVPRPNESPRKTRNNSGSSGEEYERFDLARGEYVETLSKIRNQTLTASEKHTMKKKRPKIKNGEKLFETDVVLDKVNRAYINGEAEKYYEKTIEVNLRTRR